MVKIARQYACREISGGIPAGRQAELPRKAQSKCENLEYFEETACDKVKLVFSSAGIIGGCSKRQGLTKEDKELWFHIEERGKRTGRIDTMSGLECVEL
jgi:hypothetical protein